MRYRPIVLLLFATRLLIAEETDPKKYVEASIVRIEKMATSQSKGVRADAMSEMMKLAAFARSTMRDPRLAIDLYRRAAKIQRALYGGAKPIGMNDRIADIEQFDLGDRKAAAAHLRELRALYRDEDGEFANYNRWTQRWLDAEIAWLEEGKTFDGSLIAKEMAGFYMHLFYGAGAEITNGEPIDPALNPYSPPRLTSAEMEKKLQAFRPSHANFLRHYQFAVQMSPGALRTWLTRNDPAGFWRASFLALGAIGDRVPVPAEGEGGDFLVSLVRKDGKPTALALLAREYAKTHAIPFGVR